MNISEDKKRELDRSYRRARNTSIDQLRQAIVYFAWIIVSFFGGLSISLSDWNQFARTQMVFDFVAFVFFQLMILSLFTKRGFKSSVKRVRVRPEYFILWFSISLMIFGLIDPFFFSVFKSHYPIIYGFLVLSLSFALLIWFNHHKKNKQGDPIHEQNSVR